MRLSIVLPLSGALLAAPLAASAEDFTGFYAGVNAGYAFGRDKDRAGSFALPSSGGASSDDRSLPPSAASASQAMQQSRTVSRGTPAGH